MLNDFQKSVSVQPESSLLRFQFTTKTAALIQCGDQADADPDVQRCLGHGLGHGRGIVVSGTGKVVVNIMKFSHPGVSGEQHFAINPFGDLMHFVRVNLVDELVHPFSPCPKRILPGRLVFGQTGETTLKGVAVSVGNSGDRDSVYRFAIKIPSWIKFGNFGNPAIVDRNDRVVDPDVVGQQRSESKVLIH